MSELIERHFSNAPAIIACSGGGYVLLIDGKLIARSTLSEMQRVLEPHKVYPWQRHAPAIVAVAVMILGLASLYLLRPDTIPKSTTVAAVRAAPADLAVRHVPLKIYDVVPAPKPRPQE